MNDENQLHIYLKFSRKFLECIVKSDINNEISYLVILSTGENKRAD